MYRLINNDCLLELKKIEDNTVDCILCDLPYGITSLKWDNIIPMNKLWEEYNRILKDDGNIVLFSSGIFTFKLIESNLSNFRYKLIWKKNVPTGMSSAKYRPMKYYEEICVFSKNNSKVRQKYNPIPKERIGEKKECYKYNHYCGDSNHLKLGKVLKKYDPDFVNPSDVLEFNVVPNRKGKTHPTEKPVPLLEYLIKTYSDENDIVLDNCMGSGSCGEACLNTNRNFIGIELDENYFIIAKERIERISEHGT